MFQCVFLSTATDEQNLMSRNDFVEEADCQILCEEIELAVLNSINLFASRLTRSILKTDDILKKINQTEETADFEENLSNMIISVVP